MSILGKITGGGTTLSHLQELFNELNLDESSQYAVKNSLRCDSLRAINTSQILNTLRYHSLSL